jgi:magnesium transporter
MILPASSSRTPSRGLTRKLAIVVQGDVFITLHRSQLSFIDQVWDQTSTSARLLPDLVSKSIKTYDLAIQRIHEEFETLEDEILTAGLSYRRSIPQELYTLKRRVTLMKRILRMTQDAVLDISIKFKMHQARDHLDKYLFQLEEVADNLIGILSLQVSIASQRSNEIMRVLTVYSIVFMPLNLIAGVYGMNFDHMPELRNAWGYPLALTLMVTVAVGILIWAGRKGWLQKP